MARVLLVRPAGPDADADALSARGIEVTQDPYLEITPSADVEAPERARLVNQQVSHTSDWLILTSANALRAWVSLEGQSRVEDAIAAGMRRGLRVAAVGPATARALEGLGATAVFVPSAHTGEQLASELIAPHLPGTATVPRGDQALSTLSVALRGAGWQVHDPVLYETKTVAQAPITVEGVAHGSFDVVVLRSPSAVRALNTYVASVPRSTVLVCGGPTTAAEADRLKMGTIVTSPRSDAQSIAQTVEEALTGKSPMEGDDDHTV